MVLKWIQNGPKMVPKLFQLFPLPPSPSLASAKVSCHGANKIIIKNDLDKFPIMFNKKIINKSFVRYYLMSKGIL